MAKPVNITDQELEENYKNWLGEWVPCLEPGEDLLKLVASAFPTHTFGHIKTVGKESDFPYKNIFGVGEPAMGLLSDVFRNENNLYKKGEKRRSMNAARVAGLHNYVFAYLGIHEAYYAFDPESPDTNPRPFGVFISKDIEALPGCLPSRRDVNIHSETEAEKIRKEFLPPSAARKFISYQVINDNKHANKFWHYYGAPEYYGSEGYEDAWQKRIEYHYLEKVEIKDIVAVLWPVWYRNVSKPGVKDWDPSYYAISEISSKFPHLKIIPYDWDSGNPEMCFIEASYYITQYVLKHHEFPLNVDVAKGETYE